MLYIQWQNLKEKYFLSVKVLWPYSNSGPTRSLSQDIWVNNFNIYQEGLPFIVETQAVEEEVLSLFNSVAAVTNWVSKIPKIDKSYVNANEISQRRSWYLNLKSSGH